MTATAQAPYPDHFYGFIDVPFHLYLPVGFERPRPTGDAIVFLRAAPDLVGPSGIFSPAAIFTVGEVASGIAVCDALVRLRPGIGSSSVPLVLTRRAALTPGAEGRGDLRSRARVTSSPEEIAERLRRSRKATIAIECPVLADEDRVAGVVEAEFYVRLMDIDRVERFGGQLMPGMVERARELLGTPAEGG